MTHAVGTGSIEPLKREAMKRTSAGGSFFLDGADDDDPDVVIVRPLRADARSGRNESGKGPFRIDAAAPIQYLAITSRLDADGNVAGHGVDVAEQHHRASGVWGTHLADRVANLVDLCTFVSGGQHFRHEPPGGGGLVA